MAGLGVELLARGKGGCGACGAWRGCWEGAAGVKAEEAEGMEALGAAGTKEEGLTDPKLLPPPPKGRAVLL